MVEEITQTNEKRKKTLLKTDQLVFLFHSERNKTPSLSPAVIKMCKIGTRPQIQDIYEYVSLFLRRSHCDGSVRADEQQGFRLP